MLELVLSVLLSVGQSLGLIEFSPPEKISRHEVRCFVECFDLCLVPAPPDPSVQ